MDFGVKKEELQRGLEASCFGRTGLHHHAAWDGAERSVNRFQKGAQQARCCSMGLIPGQRCRLEEKCSQIKVKI